MVKKLLRRARETRETLDENNVGTEANISLEREQGTPEGRYPIGDGWYRTPEVIDPRDPINYPDSPWNGGNPISETFAGMDFGITFHQCGWDLDAQATIGWMKLPIHGLSYRRPGECRNEPPPPPPPDFSGLPEPAEFSKASNFDHDWGVKDEDFVFCLLGIIGLSGSWIIPECPGGPNRWLPSASVALGGDLTCGYFVPYQSTSKETEYAQVKFTQSLASSFQTWEEIQCSPGVKGNKLISVTMGPTKSNTHLWSRGDRSAIYEEISKVTLVTYRRYTGPNEFTQMNPLSVAPAPHERIEVSGFHTNYSCVYGRWAFIKQVYGRTGRLPPRSYQERICLGVLNPIKCSFPPYAKNPPPPDLDDKECCMQCCSESNQQQEDYSDLLRRILKIVTNVENRLGCKEYPFNVPTSLISESENFISSLLPKPTKQIENTQQFLRWKFDVFEEIIGQYEIPIEIKDSDPTKPGEQPEGMKIKNIAEGMGELVAIGANASVNTEVLINMHTRLLYELAASRQTIADTNAKAKALIDFFGFKTKEKIDEMEMSITIGKDRLDETLQESKHPVSITLFDDTKKTYKHDMAALLNSANIIRTTFTKKAKGGDLAGTAAAIAAIVKQQKKNQDKLDGSMDKIMLDDFNKFCEDFERGWMDEIPLQTGEAPGNPWGESYSERPKIVRVVRNTDSKTT